MKSLSILGSTGSIGTNALEIVRQFPGQFRVVALAAKTSIAALARQIVEFSPRLAAVIDDAHAGQLRSLLPADVDVRIVTGDAGYVMAATLPESDMVLGAMVGAAGLAPTLAAIDAGKDIALANKETLVMGGEIVMARVAERGVKLMPVDSEHSAIFQSLAGHCHSEVREILLTASGGPFRQTPAAEFATITPAAALRHPNWSMGSKITIDSATLMNKGLEVIEARWLFDVDFDRIKVVVHPQSIIHSMVTYQDGAVIAQLGIPDMKGAIAYGLSHPDRLPLDMPAPDFAALGQLTFEDPDLERFPCLALAFRAGVAGGTHPAVLNAANEIAVAAFLEGRLPYTGIYAIIDQTLNRHRAEGQPDLERIIAADRWARKTAVDLIRQQEC
ncbi:1-deoxy-D-xylulose 5-phosphate reductoisomerase [Desulfosarcina ovata subsp. sediminis]|uniref:1-deoxy-D-xylulose 5-phosphate reductoisomerase n=1 Tax=Desulfosarcina ovata subsp. sediminis TaxID=885957 RepID=A0A5K8A2L5_9BACT|nr:1-deoxy-D-xylulose-5-phosphate reductoisomerase [Desulfosarcina ovata]BBO86648.1 1-deoxy-D-xylulose 5-phosphate reductoisomerase [Desulfosarcina ovata subsp. sediminis]